MPCPLPASQSVSHNRLVLEAFRKALPKARPGRRPDPSVAKAAAKIQAQMEAAGPRRWQPVYREHIPDYRTLAPG